MKDTDERKQLQDANSKKNSLCGRLFLPTTVNRMKRNLVNQNWSHIEIPVNCVTVRCSVDCRHFPSGALGMYSSYFTIDFVANRAPVGFPSLFGGRVEPARGEVMAWSVRTFCHVTENRSPAIWRTVFENSMEGKQAQEGQEPPHTHTQDLCRRV